MTEKGKRITIGILVGGITDDFTRMICRGAEMAAKQLDVNLVTLPGKYIYRDVTDYPDLIYEYQFNTIFSYGNIENLDAIIVVAGSIGCFTSQEKIEQLLAQYEDVPTVLVAYRLDNHINVQFDNYQGIRDGLEYLIHHVGCTKFGMIGGSFDNSDAKERRSAFFEMMEEHDLVVPEKAYVEGNFSRDSKKAFEEILDNNPDLEAVFCVNDDTAIGFYEELERRGIRPGKDLYILGFDDVIMATKMEPSLSSVRANGSELGEEAIRMAVRLTKGEMVESRVLPTHFIKRASTGNAIADVTEKHDKIDEEVFEAYFKDIFYHYQHTKYLGEFEHIHTAFIQLMEKLFKVYQKPDSTQEDYADIQDTLVKFLDSGALDYAEISNMLSCFENIHAMLKAEVTSEEDRLRLDDIFVIIYRRIVRATDVQIGRMTDSQEKENYSMKMFIRDVLSFEKGNDLSYASMLGNLDWLGVKNAYIYTFNEPIMHLAKEYFVPPRNLYLKAMMQNGTVTTIPALKQMLTIDDLFGNDFMDQSKRFSYVCMPLFSSEMLYGLIVCDLTEGIFINGEFLLNQISAAAKMINLLRENEKIQQELENSLLVLRENNINLDNLSKLDALTGILNRRGFYAETEKLIEANKLDGKNTLVIYVDMNNLKIINDRYGHEEGDFSIKLISDILSEEAIKLSGVAGRIGGDEFAMSLPWKTEDEGAELLQKIYDRFTEFNEGSEKAYNVTVSAGAHLMNGRDDLTLKQAMILADEKLYEVKKYRKKDVAK